MSAPAPDILPAPIEVAATAATRRWRIWLALGGLLLLAWLVYLPGLSGDFLFDDFVNLNAIGASGRVDDWPTFWRYITSGTADPTGRPIAMLSFLLEAREWPAQPYPFLRDNVLLHLLNGALLFLLLRRLGAALALPANRAEAAALLGAGVWLLHPLLVSTTLYVVQRQAMLPATFCLLGLVAYVIGRERFVASGGRAGVAWMLFGVVGGTLFALLSKANGVLLPLLALALDWTLLGRSDAALDTRALARLRRLRLVLLVLPSLLLFAWLASHLGALGQPSTVRPWTLGERLLTQPRVLLDYLGLLVLPRSVSTGLFNDAYEASRSLFQPWTTLPALLLIAGLVAFALAFRKRWPAWSAALLFYFGGHLLESSVVPLELYFEHRNYLPAMLLFWPLAVALCQWRRGPAIRATVALLVLTLFALTTWQRSSIWGQPERMAALWAQLQRTSPRAQAAAAIVESGAGRPDLALRRLGPAWRARPHDLQIAFNYIDARCALGGPSPEEKRALAEALRRTPTSELLTHNWLSSAIAVAEAGDCPQLTVDDVAGWIDAALANPVINSRRTRNEDIEPLLAQLALLRRQPDAALRHLGNALRANPNAGAAARQAVMLASNEYYREALAHLDLYERVKSTARRSAPGMGTVHAWVLRRQNYWPREHAILRQKLRAEILTRDQAR